MKRATSAALVAVVMSLPSVVYACPVCFSAQNEDNRVAFIVSTMFLTLLPLGMLTAGLWWAWRKLRQQDEPVVIDASDPASAPARLPLSSK